jgi:hypothetical protein
MSSTEERYVFECEWFDEQADLIRKYLLTYFPRNQTIEMVSSTSPLTDPLVRSQDPQDVPQENGLWRRYHGQTLPWWHRDRLL